MPRFDHPAGDEMVRLQAKIDRLKFDLRETLRAVLHYFGPSGASKVTQHVMMAREHLMRTKSAVPKILEQIKAAISDHVIRREDRHGFSRLDVLLAEIEAKAADCRPQIEAATIALIPTLNNDDARTWEAIRMTIDAAGLRSPAVANCIIKILDRFESPMEPAARFQAFLAYRASGGTLTRPRLDKEKLLHNQMRPQWVDLVLSAYYGAPDSIISFLEEQLSEKQGKFTWEDVRRRLPLIFRLLGPDFNRGIVRVTRAIRSKAGQEHLAAAVNASFKINPLFMPRG